MRKLNLPKFHNCLLLLAAGGMICTARLSSSADITITHLAEADSWRVDYQLPSPVNQMVFVRTQTLFRDSSWEPKTEGVEISREGNHEVVRRVDGGPMQHFSIVAPSTTDRMSKDYSQNFQFTDGSQLLYTGHFTIAENRTEPVEYSLRLVPAAGETIVVRGRHYDG